MDASPNALVRGAFNGAIATFFESASMATRHKILELLERHTRKAVNAAINETKELDVGWSRRPHIRFAHVGELPAYPEFANAVAAQVSRISGDAVDCVVYTRHRNAKKLDPSLWIVNFTLDKASASRRSWVPAGARIVFSAWDGEIDPHAATNFLEHHRWSHASPTGQGAICPTTLPQTTIRSCDAVRCSLCFRRPD